MHLKARTLLPLALALAFPCAGPAEPQLRESAVELNDNGAWSWFMDERAIVDKDRLIVGSVRANGTFKDKDRPGWGNIELSILADGKVQRVVLHEKLEQDDHNNPGLMVLPDGRYLAAYSKHAAERRMYWRTSKRAGDPYEWNEERSLETPGSKRNYAGDNVTYANPFRLSEEPDRMYLFHRGYSHDPNYLISTDGGENWKHGGHWLVGRDGYAPYLKYTSNGRDKIHFITTEDHPRNFDNSLYHGFIKGRKLHLSDGTEVAPLHEGLDPKVRTWDFTRVFKGSPDQVAWMTDIHLDDKEHPVILFTVQRGSGGLAPRQGGDDHRFHYARWDGTRWHQQEIAYAGKRLYPFEDDYTGLGAIDPQDVNQLVISTDADPVTGKPLVSATDGQRHHELFRGRTTDGGKTWNWHPLTRDSDADNLRPLIPSWNDANRLALVWMRGTYRHNHGEWTTKVMSAFLDRKANLPPEQ